MSSLMKRLKRIEKIMIVGNEDFVYIHVGTTCFTLFGNEAREHVAKEHAAFRPHHAMTTYGDGNSSITVYRPRKLSGEIEVAGI